MNSGRKLRSLGIALILVLAMGILPLAAQDTGTERVNCDSTLILLAGLAQRYFGFTSLSGMDMTTFEYGQYSPFWDMSMSSDTPQGTIGGAGTGNTAGDAAGSTGTGDTSNFTGGISGEAQATESASGSSDDQMQPEATADMNMPSIYLNPPALMDEDPMCMQLRAELEGFFATQLANPDWDMNFRGAVGGMGTVEPGMGG